MRKREPFVLAIDAARMAFTDRYAGISLTPEEVERFGPRTAALIRKDARARTAAAFGLESGKVVYMRQTHGTDVQHVTGPLSAEALPLDGVCTTDTSLALAVLVADCAPVLLADPAGGVVGAAHAGRVGLAGGIVLRLLELMIAHGAQPSRMTTLVGPTVCELCYEVSPRLREETAAVAPGAWATTMQGAPSVNLRFAIETQLRSAGVSDVRHDRRCTFESPELFSFRREGPTGDFAGYVWLEP
ncbi:peptidoglycan editing factor PgeF [Spirillospora sp. NPDC048911]|uniref:peptidoglycan editing factor PgeF n=1 Tax=Spirillospora sp. NPDC048911 TaxID=3364527 RepID=UPI003711FF67